MWRYKYKECHNQRVLVKKIWIKRMSKEKQEFTINSSKGNVLSEKAFGHCWNTFLRLKFAPHMHTNIYRFLSISNYLTHTHFSQDKCTSSVTQQFSYSRRKKKLKVNIAFLNNINFLLWNIKSGLQNSALFYALLLYWAESTWSPLNLEAKQTRVCR